MSDKNEGKHKSFLIIALGINLALGVSVLIITFTVKITSHNKVITSALDRVQQVSEKSAQSIGLHNIQTLKKLSGYLQNSSKAQLVLQIKNNLRKIYKENNLASPPVIYSLSNKHNDLMYILSSAELTSSFRDIYKVSDPVKKAYHHKQIISTITDTRQNGLNLPTALSTIPFTDKYGKVYGVMLMEFDLSPKMEEATKAGTLIGRLGIVTYLILFIAINIILRPKKKITKSISKLSDEQSKAS